MGCLYEHSHVHLQAHILPRGLNRVFPKKDASSLRGALDRCPRTCTGGTVPPSQRMRCSVFGDGPCPQSTSMQPLPLKKPTAPSGCHCPPHSPWWGLRLAGGGALYLLQAAGAWPADGTGHGHFNLVRLMFLVGNEGACRASAHHRSKPGHPRSMLVTAADFVHTVGEDLQKCV